MTMTGTPMRALVLLALIALPAHAATVAVTPDNLTAALAAAQPGDILQFSGQFGAITLKNRTFAPPLTLDLTHALTGSLTFNTDAGLEVRGGDIAPTVWSGGVYVLNSRAVHMSGMTTRDTHTVNGVTIRSSADVSLSNSTLLGATDGVSVLYSHDVTIDGNTISGVSQDGAQIVSSQRVNFIYNLCSGSLNDGVHHPDCAQTWSAAGFDQSADVTIRFNQFNGATQGADDFGGDARGVLRLEISDNDYLGSYPQAFAVQKSSGAVVRRNRARTMPGATWRAAINLTAPAVQHCGNTADAYSGRPAWSDTPCVVN